MSLNVVTLGKEVLREKAKPVETFDAELENIINEMFALMDERRGVGLAAPQVGISRRFFITNAPDDRKRVFINPEIIATSQETVKAEEGCLSLPGVWGNVERSVAISIQAYDVKGKIFRLNAEDWLARVIQHEYDHLDGKLFVDRMSDNARNKLISQYERMNQNK